jgi:hypothetical protein
VKLAGKAKRVEKSESIEVSIPQEAMTGTSEVIPTLTPFLHPPIQHVKGLLNRRELPAELAH